jgi:hypothetical protein
VQEVGGAGGEGEFEVCGARDNWTEYACATHRDHQASCTRAAPRPPGLPAAFFDGSLRPNQQQAVGLNRRRA